jgi:hypothetical protein
MSLELLAYFSAYFVILQSFLRINVVVLHINVGSSRY